MQRLTEQKRERDEVEFQSRMMNEKFDDFDYVVEEVQERQSYCFNEELMEYEFWSNFNTLIIFYFVGWVGTKNKNLNLNLFILSFQ